ncbi:hypothetical protein EPR50_G00145190 [Perca flavescens]|uniref:Uncharacterized protein n=1 Tax=Perca flavescens TaxID=8167 RepID=A0A484CRC3_PERFV|nr:hypothetical protein EPR50_G00145190 [Perca flavescens]
MLFVFSPSSPVTYRNLLHVKANGSKPQDPTENRKPHLDQEKQPILESDLGEELAGECMVPGSVP